MIYEFYEKIKETVELFIDKSVFQKSASLSYYSLITFTSGLIALSSFAGFILSEEAFAEFLLEEVDRLFGEAVVTSLSFFLESAERAGQNTASILGFLLILLFSTSAVVDAQKSLQNIFGVRRKKSFKGLAWRRLLSLAVLVATTLAFFAVVLVTWLLSFIVVSNYFITIPNYFVVLINTAGLVVFSSVFFYLLYRSSSKRVFSEKAMVKSALLAGLLFTVGKFFIEIYLNYINLLSIYGAAGLLVATLIWIYYSSCIFFFGACYCKVNYKKQNL